MATIELGENEECRFDHRCIAHQCDHRRPLRNPTLKVAAFHPPIPGWY
jgi:hypothetical protein